MGTESLYTLTQDRLGNFWNRVEFHGKLQKLLEEKLPPAFRGHVQVACIQGDSLVLCTDSPLWASDLRYRSNNVLQIVNSCYKLKLLRCQVQVKPGAFLKRQPSPVRN